MKKTKFFYISEIIGKWNEEETHQAWERCIEWLKSKPDAINKSFKEMLITDFLISEGDSRTREVNNEMMENGFIEYAGLCDTPEIRQFLSEHDLLMEDWRDIEDEYRLRCHGNTRVEENYN